MAVMMNTLGRRAQAQSDAQPQTTTGQEGEVLTKEKVFFFYISIYQKKKKVN